MKPTLEQLKIGADRMLGRLALGESRIEGSGKSRFLDLGGVEIQQQDIFQVTTIAGTRLVPGWTAHRLRALPGDRETPPDVEAEEIYRGSNPWEALTKGVTEIARQVCEDTLVCLAEEETGE